MAAAVATKTTKVTVNLPSADVEFIKEFAETRCFSSTHALKESIALLRFVVDQLGEGSKILVEQKSGTIREMVFPWAR
jgi:hypothetical protein